MERNINNEEIKVLESIAWGDQQIDINGNMLQGVILEYRKLDDTDFDRYIEGTKLDHLYLEGYKYCLHIDELSGTYHYYILSKHEVEIIELYSDIITKSIRRHKNILLDQYDVIYDEKLNLKK